MKTLTADGATPGRGRLANLTTPFWRLGLLLWATLLPSFSCCALTTLYSFTNKFDGSQPYAGLALGNDGNFYGTCFDGGTNDLGSVFKISPGGALTPLFSFSFTNGETPTAGLTQGADGNFYGTTFEGGSNFNFGTVFEISTNGVFNSLYSFTGGSDGAYPYAGLVQGANGAFYGTTLDGGASGDGVVFQITAAGALTPLYSFTNGVDGSQPRATLILASDGTFYGTTFAGGSSGYGVVFSITAAGALTPLHSFNGGSDGANPVGQLTQGTNGVLYGTAYAGGANGDGTVFQITTGGAFSVPYSFTGGSDGAYPAAGLALGSDGNFYGTTYGGGTNSDGGIFKITPQGALTPLYLFTGGDDGSSSLALLVQGNDGNFYGTTQYGGSNGDGVVFSINPFSAAPVLTSITLVSGTIEITWSGLPGQLYQAQYATNLTQTTWSDLGRPVTAVNGVGSKTDSAPVNAQRFYRVYLVP
jgi:uncharacterized repeat protein (TIGR03803 family)